MALKMTFNVSKLKEDLAATRERLESATRPAAQVGAQILYDAAKRNALSLRSDREHWFYGEAAKKLQKGKKKSAAYGPFKPGSLYESIYQVFSKDNSFRDVSTYHVSWNAKKAPYGGMVERGTKGPRAAAAHSFIGKAFIETRQQVREAMKRRYLEEVSKL